MTAANSRRPFDRCHRTVTDVRPSVRATAEIDAPSSSHITSTARRRGDRRWSARQIVDFAISAASPLGAVSGDGGWSRRRTAARRQRSRQMLTSTRTSHASSSDAPDGTASATSARPADRFPARDPLLRRRSATAAGRGGTAARDACRTGSPSARRSRLHSWKLTRRPSRLPSRRYKRARALVCWRIITAAVRGVIAAPGAVTARSGFWQRRVRRRDR